MLFSVIIKVCKCVRIPIEYTHFVVAICSIMLNSLFMGYSLFFRELFVCLSVYVSCDFQSWPIIVSLFPPRISTIQPIHAKAIFIKQTAHVYSLWTNMPNTQSTTQFLNHFGSLKSEFQSNVLKLQINDMRP